MTQDQFIALLNGYYAGTLSENEKLELSRLLHDPQYREQLEQLFKDDITDAAFTSAADTEILEFAYQGIQLKKQSAPVRRIYAGRYRWAAAAAILVFLSVAAYLFIYNKPAEQKITNTIIPANDIAAPAGYKAILTLGDGKQIIVDSAHSGPIATIDNVSITKNITGQVVYTGHAVNPEWNTLTVPKGSRPVQLKLADGSEVWINAASSVTYPVAFAGAERKLTISGEAYFEVASHVTASGAKQSFIVQKGEMQVRVLGTHFNVKAYDDEPDTRITLLEGSVKVSVAGGESSVLKPGQQAALTHDSLLTTHDAVDTDKVMAWKNGYFEFDSENIQTVMRQLARWYNVDIEYRGEISTSNLSAIIDRNNNISQVLNMLQTTGKFQFVVEGRKIIVYDSQH